MPEFANLPDAALEAVEATGARRFESNVRANALRGTRAMSNEGSTGRDGGRRPLLIVNPLDDATFVRVVHHRLPGCDDAAELEARLRRDFPRVAVHPRELSGERKRVWYVYRDGHWTPSRGSR